MRTWIPLPALVAGLVALATVGFLAQRAYRAIHLTATEGIRDRLRAEATANSAAAGNRFRVWHASRAAGPDVWRMDAEGRFVTPPEPSPLVPLTLPPDTPERMEFFLREGERAEHADGDPGSAAGFYRMAAADSVPPGIRRVALARLGALESRRGNPDAALAYWRGAAALAGDSELLLMAAVAGAVDRARVVGFLVRHLGGDDRGTVSGYAERLGLADHPEVRSRALEVRRMERIRPRLLPPPPPGEIRSVALPDGGRAFVGLHSVVIATPEDLRGILGPNPQLHEGVEHLSVPAPPPLDDFELTATARPKEHFGSVMEQTLLLSGTLVVAVLAAGVSLWILVSGVRRQAQLARLKSDFVANVSHELRTPLSVVRLYAETLASRRVPEGEEAEYAGVVLREADSLSNLVDRVLDFSRIERGTKEYAPRACDLADLVREAVERFGGDGLAANIPDRPVPVRVDREAILGAMANLLDNARKYAAGSAIEVTLPVDDGFARIEVRDRGPGLSPDEANRVFSRFHRGERAVRDAVRGSGLGLTLVRHAARGHGGDAGYRPRSGGGAVFFIRLPTEES